MIFVLSFLFIQKCCTVSDSFSIATELLWTCFPTAIYNLLSVLQMKTDMTNFVDPQDVPYIFYSMIILMLATQLHITYYYTWKIISSMKHQRIILSRAINLKMVLKNREYFFEFEKQLKQEYSIENLNFLISCAQYRWTAILHGNFGFESSTSATDFDSENFELLNWKGLTTNFAESDPGIMIKIAQDIFDEYCQPGAPQEISLSQKTATRLSKKIENLLKICGYPERNIFCEARREVEKLLSEDALKRFKGAQAARSVDNKWRIPQIYDEYGKPFLTSPAIDDHC